MSEPKRYGLSRETCDIVEWRYGPYVGIEDYQKIEDKCQRYKAEVERLRKGDERDMTAAYLYAAEQSKDVIARLKAEVERLGAFKTHTIIPNQKLQTQIKRLTKAGDAMAKVITEFRCGPYGKKVKNAFVVWKQWHAAKDGKDAR